MDNRPRDPGRRSHRASTRQSPPAADVGRELIVAIRAGALVRQASGRYVGGSGGASREVLRLLASSDASIEPLFGGEAPPAWLPNTLVQAMATYFAVHAPDSHLESLVARLAALPDVEAAYIKPAVEVAAYGNRIVPTIAAAPARTPDFTPCQLYLDIAPSGVDARHAWTVRGGSGTGVKIIDIEGAWLFTHEDLRKHRSGVVGGKPPDDPFWRSHGTAVAGIFGGDRNDYGVTGISPKANTLAYSIFGCTGTARAIRDAANLVRAGDIMLIEVHRPGPGSGFQFRPDQAGYIAIEWWPDDFVAMQYATCRGVLVVECAGNGGKDLGDPLYDTPFPGFPPSWVNPFRRVHDSGAILVGAGAPPPNTHGRDHGPDRSRLKFSNFGPCVDVQAWGQEVSSCGYGDLQNGPEERCYTNRCGGTSSAAPIVAGVVASIQGALRAAHRPPLTPAAGRALLRETGSPQESAPECPITERIGNRPDLRQAFRVLELGD